VEVQAASSDGTSQEKEAANAEATSTVEQPALTSGKGSTALVRVQPESRGWDHPCVLWWSRDDPEGEPLFALEDAAEGGAGAPSSNTTSWRSGRYGRPSPWWPTNCPESPRFAFSFLARRCLFLGFVAINDPCSASPGARDPVPWEVGLSPAGEGRLGLASAAKGPSCRRQQAPVGAECGGRGHPPSLCRREGRGGHGLDTAHPSGSAGQGVGGGAYPRGQRSGCL